MKWLLVLLLTLPVYAEYRTFELSFYCNCMVCCGRYAGGLTASGTVPKRYRTAASNTLSLGARVRIEGYGWRTIEDRMSGAYSHRLDVYVPSHKQAKQLGIQNRRVWIERAK